MDKAHNIIDEKLVEIEKKLKSLYSSALSDMQKKSNDYFKHFMSEDEAQKEKVKMGEISEKSYIEWRKKNIMIGNGFTALKEDIAKKLLEEVADFDGEFAPAKRMERMQNRPSF